MADQVFSDNISRYLRMSGILRPNRREEEIEPIDFNINEEDDYDPAMRLKQLYQPESRMTNQYHDALASRPQRNTPGLARKLTAGLAAFAGPEQVERTLYGPYQRELEDWESKIKPLAAGASLEKQNNTNLRMGANQVMSQEMNDRRLQRQSDRDSVLRRQGDERINATEGRYKTLEDQANQRIKQADARIKIAAAVAKGGQVNVDDAGNGRIVYKDGTVEPFDGQYLSAEEKAKLRQQYPTGGARDRVRSEIIDDPDNPGRRIAVSINLDTQEVKRLKLSGADGTKTDVTPVTKDSDATTELATGRSVDNRATQAKSGPLGKYVEMSKTGKFIRIKPTGRFLGPTKEQYDELYQSIYGRNTAGQAVNSNNKPKVSDDYTPPAGRVRVVGPNGLTGTVSAEEATRLPAGWSKK